MGRKGKDRDSWKERESKDMREDAKSKGRRSGSNRRKFKAKDVSDSPHPERSRNDVSWYTKFPELAESAAKINWANIIGKPNSIGPTEIPRSDMLNIWAADPQWGYKDTPGVAKFTIIPTFGFSTDQSSPLNVAANQMYANIRYVNSGAKNYDAVDLMVHILGMTGIYSCLNYLILIYSLGRSYQAINQFWPKGILKAHNIDEDDLVAHLSDFYFYILSRISKISALPVPATFDLFRREAFLYRHIYIEGESLRDQLYTLQPEGFWKFSPFNDGTAGGNVSVKVWDDTAPITVQYMESYLDELIDQYFGDEDAGIISGDILKAFGDNIIQLGTFSPDITEAPVYDPMVLTQLKNSFPVAYPKAYITPNFDIKQDATRAYLESTPMIGVGYSDTGIVGIDFSWSKFPYLSATTINMLTGKQTITINHPNPTPDMLIEATRFTPTVHDVTWDNTTGRAFGQLWAASDVVNRIFLYKYEMLSPDSAIPYVHRSLLTAEISGPFVVDTGDVNPFTIDMIQGAEYARAFHYLPRRYMAWIQTDSSNPSSDAFLEWREEFETTNWTLVDRDALDKINYAALLSLVHITPAAFYKGR